MALLPLRKKIQNRKRVEAALPTLGKNPQRDKRIQTLHTKKQNLNIEKFK